MEATVADWITAAFTAVLAVVTLVLAIATARYVTQTGASSRRRRGAGERCAAAESKPKRTTG